MHRVSQARKFDFDTAFDFLVEPSGDDAAAEHGLRAAEIERVRASAYEEGLRAGEDRALQRAEQQTADALQSLSASVALLFERLADAEARLREEAQSLAVIVARKLVGELPVAAHRGEIERTIAEAMSLLRREPRLVIRVHPELAEAIDARITDIASQCGFAGRITVNASPEMRHPDCQIEGADGGVARDLAAIEREIEAIVRTHMSPAAAAHHGADADPGNRAGRTGTGDGEPDGDAARPTRVNSGS